MPEITPIPVPAGSPDRPTRGAAAADSGKTGKPDDFRGRARDDETSFTDSLQQQLASQNEKADETGHPQGGNMLPPDTGAAESGRITEQVPVLALAAETNSVTLTGRAEAARVSTAQTAGNLQQSRASATAGLDSTAVAVEAAVNAEAGSSRTDSLFASRLMQSGADAFAEKLAGSNTHESQSFVNRAPSAESPGASAFRAPGPLNATADLSTPAQPAVSESFGRPEWSQGLGRQVLWMVNHNLRSAEMRMNPANLGPIEVRIDMDDDQVSVAFNSRHAVVREAVEQAIPRLREMFEAEGLNLAHTDISQHSFAEQRDRAFDSDSGSRAGFDDAASAQDDSGSQQQAGGPALSNGLVDCYI